MNAQFLPVFLLAVTHNGLCHTDVHMVDNDWGMTMYPLVPGHEVCCVGGRARALLSDCALHAVRLVNAPLITTAPLLLQTVPQVVGVVAAKGSQVTEFEIGDRVGYSGINGSCGACGHCIGGEENICLKGWSGTFMGGNHGGFQTFMRQPAKFAYK
eukprot:scaffold213332_cov21-Tisochrysis_lutea.AAC.1